MAGGRENPSGQKQGTTNRYETLVKNTPLERILTETDAPWLTPEPLRGKRNEPKNIKIICEKIAEIKGLTFEEINKVTTDNTRKLFFKTN